MEGGDSDSQARQKEWPCWQHFGSTITSWQMPHIRSSSTSDTNISGSMVGRDAELKDGAVGAQSIWSHRIRLTTFNQSFDIK